MTRNSDLSTTISRGWITPKHWTVADGRFILSAVSCSVKSAYSCFHAVCLVCHYVCYEYDDLLLVRTMKHT